jgi:signal recognition particle GTPase
VNALLTQFKQMQRMMKQITSGKGKGLLRMLGM